MKNNSDWQTRAFAAARSTGSFLAKFAALYAACGVYDLSRNTKIDEAVTKRYFLGNGLFTWILSPLNVVLDILSLPFINKGIYRLEDFPKEYQAEITRVLDASVKEDLVAKLNDSAKDRKKTMVFFKWYGKNVDSAVDIPAFHEHYNYIQTIGVSVFNKKQSTSKHFGPLRATLRILYNVNQMDDDSAYITVGDTTSYWRTNKLFIFDDTLMHQSINETEQARYCMFIDILRPSLIPAFFAGFVSLIRVSMKSVNYIFYKNWDVI